MHMLAIRLNTDRNQSENNAPQSHCKESNKKDSNKFNNDSNVKSDFDVLADCQKQTMTCNHSQLQRDGGIKGTSSQVGPNRSKILQMTPLLFWNWYCWDNVQTTLTSGCPR